MIERDLEKLTLQGGEGTAEYFFLLHTREVLRRFDRINCPSGRAPITTMFGGRTSPRPDPDEIGAPPAYLWREARRA